MFEKDNTLYKNDDYTARSEACNGVRRYFIQFHGQVEDSPEIEVELDMFLLYTKEFNKPLEIQRNEFRRHLYWGELDETIAFSISNQMGGLEQSDLWQGIHEVLKTCTQTQKRRFELFAKGYQLTDIARLEHCEKQRAKKSVDTVLAKIKKYFL
ncbi:MAG: hypothetical protein FWD84_00670 [Oscillospiraceae bacterium]|nr:hypothetical protein [Oscillospiraceae bacterium]